MDLVPLESVDLSLVYFLSHKTNLFLDCFCRIHPLSPRAIPQNRTRYRSSPNPTNELPFELVRKLFLVMFKLRFYMQPDEAERTV